MITQEFLKEHLEYRDGHLWCVKKRSKNTVIGSRAGCLYKTGYVYVSVNNKRIPEHRLIWLYHHGVWPKEFLDHINGIRDDNRIENLREANNQQNQFNSNSNTGYSKYKGVCWDKPRQKWRAYYMINGKYKFIGNFDDEVEAALAYDDTVRKIHGNFTRLNFG